MRKELCRAFCDEISVRDVPVGLAISTAFHRMDGDAVGFYVVNDRARTGFAHLEDDGTTIPYLEASGVDFETQTRQVAFQELLGEYGAEFDDDDAVIRTPAIKEADLPRAAMRFVALLLRLSDFLLIRQEHVESAFKEDAAKRIKDAVGNRAVIEEGEPVNSRLKEVTPDLVLHASGRDPVAVFLANSPQRMNDAIFLQMAALYEARQSISVIALLERETSVSRDLRQRAANRLATVPVYSGDEEAAIQRIEREVVGTDKAIH
jgi:hypothetical protein